MSGAASVRGPRRPCGVPMRITSVRLVSYHAPILCIAVVVGAWMTNSQFLDGIALSGILPAPLIIFSTFVGYFGGGPWGALAMTFGIFLPAFAFTLLGHDYLDRVIANPSIHTFLDGVTAGVVGLIAATTLDLFRQGITSLPAAVILHWRWRPSICGKRRRRLRGS